MRLQSVDRSTISRDRWDDYVSRHQNGWWFHTSDWIEYAIQYSPGSKDLSYVVVENGTIEGVVPLVMSESSAYGGQITAAPLDHFIGPLRHRIIGRPGEVIWSAPVLQQLTTRVVQISSTKDEMWKTVRRSYHSLIHRAEESYEIVTDPALIENAKGIHIVSSGRQTRSDGTWAMQEKWLKENRAVLVSAISKKTGDVKGFAYFIAWKGWAYYFSSACLDENLAHALIWNGMMRLKEMGIRSVELGHETADDEKGKGIAFFKTGFGGESWPVTIAGVRA